MPSTLKGLRDESIAREKVEGQGRTVSGSRLETIIQNVTAATILPDNVTLESASNVWNVKDGGIDTTQLADGAVTDAKVDTGISADKLVDGTTNHVFTASDDTKLTGIEALADVTDAGNVGSSIHGASAKTTPVDADTMPLIDSAASNVLKKVTWANIKATLKTYFDTLYSTTTTFLGLSDTPASYSTKAYYLVEVNGAENALQFKGIASGYVARGTSTGLGVGLIQDDNATVGINGNPGVGRLNIADGGTTLNGLYLVMSNGSGLAGLLVSHAGSNPGVETVHTGTGHGLRGYVNNGSSSADGISGETTGTGAGVHGTGTGTGKIGLKGSGDIGLHINGGLQHTVTTVTGTTHTLLISESEVHFNLGAACAVALPALSTLAVGWRCRVRDIANNIASNNVTFNRDGSDVFTSGATSWVWATSNASADLVVADWGSGTKRWYHE